MDTGGLMLADEDLAWQRRAPLTAGRVHPSALLRSACLDDPVALAGRQTLPGNQLCQPLLERMRLEQLLETNLAPRL
jgi:hypothetical protein